MKIPRAALLVLAPVLAVSLTACVPLDEPTMGETTTSSTQADSAASEPENDGVGAFGQKVSWDGVDVVVSVPEAYKPSQYAVGAGENNVSFEVKLTNTGDEPYDPALVMITASSAETEAEAVFDPENDITTPPTTKVRSGKSVTWTVAFAVADPADVLVEVAPDFTTESVLLSTDA